MSTIWGAIREALRGGRRDYTEGSLNKAILLLAIPMVLETAMESLFAIVDIFFVSKLGRDAMAVVALTESMVVLVIAVALGLGFATTAFVARRIGEKKPEEASHGAAQSILFGFCASVLIGGIGAVLAPDLLRLMGADEAVLKHIAFAHVLLGGVGTLMMIFLLNAVFRGAGDAAIAMRVLWFANAINIVLNPCLIFGLGPFPELGVAGSALGTTIGRGSGVLYQLWLLRSGAGRIHIRPEHWRLDVPLMKHILRPALNGMFQIFVGTAAWTMLIRTAATFGSTVLAGYTLGIRVIMFSIMPAWGLANAAATLVGQSLGARKPERAEAAVWKAGHFNAVFLGTLSLVYMLLAESIIGLFTSDAAIVEAGSTCLRYVSACYILYAYGMVLLQAFNGAGDTWTPTRINIVASWLVQLPLAWFLGRHLGLGPKGMYGAVSAGQIVFVSLAAFFFRKGNWKRTAI